jgi:gamma-glutamyltranspeptidase/glutathione hydrolase
MAPSLLLTGNRVEFVLGTPGGDTIPSTLAQIIQHLVDEHQSLADAVEAPRFHHGFVPDVARYEPLPSSWSGLLRTLQSRGHTLKPFWRRVGDANCILIDGTRAIGYADSREPGVAIAASAP